MTKKTEDTGDEGGGGENAELQKLQEALEKTKAQLSEMQTKHRKATEKLKAYENDDGELIDPKAAAEAMAKVGEMAKWTPEEKVKQQIESIQAQLQEKHAKEIEKLTARGSKLQGKLTQTLVTNTATAALVKAGVEKENIELLLPHVERAVQVVEENDDFVARVHDIQGNVVLSKKADSNAPMPVEEYVETLKDRFPAAFPGTRASGSGAGSDRSGGGGGGGKFTMTAEQARDVGAYRAMREQAEKAGATVQILAD